MKATGIVRKVDELGRVVIPMELRKTMGIDIKDPLEIFVEEETIILKKYEPACIFCGNAKDTVTFGGRVLCRKCIDAVKDELKKEG